MDDKRAAVYQTQISESGNDDPRFMVARWIRPGTKVLDVGCACGDLGVFLKDKLGCEVHGLDYNASSIEIAKKLGAYVGLRHVDLNSFSPNDFPCQGAFDAIVICDVLEHLLDPLSSLLKLKSFLKEDGRLLLSIPNVAHASVKILLISNKIRYTKTGLLDETHLHFYTWRTLFDLLGRASLEADAIDIVPRAMNGGFPGDLLGYVSDKHVLGAILRDDESYAYQYVLRVRASTVPASYKRFSSLVKQCFADRASLIDALRAEDLRRTRTLNPATLRLRHAEFRGRMLTKTIANMVAPSEKRRKKINDLAEKVEYLRQALRS